MKDILNMNWKLCFENWAKKLSVAVFLLHAGLIGAQTVAPSAIPPPQNTPYAGTMAIEVDLTDLDRKIMPVRQTLPVQPGLLTLLYPRWIPGTHPPTGSVSRMAGLQITANGKPVQWTRDTVDGFAFHLSVPPDAKVLEINFQHLSPVSPASGRVVMTPEIIGLQWNTVVLYPAGYFVSGIQARASAKLPPGWQKPRRWMWPGAMATGSNSNPSAWRLWWILRCGRASTPGALNLTRHGPRRLPLHLPPHLSL